MINNRFIAPTRLPKVKQSKEDISILLISGSIPYGMKAYGPKPLLNVIGGLTLLEKQIQVINNVFPNSEITVILGYEADKIIKKKYNIRIIENQLYETTGESEQVRLGLNSLLTKDVLIINGDLIFNEHAISFEKEKNSILISNKEKNKSEIGATLVDNKVTFLSYTLEEYKWANIFYVSSKNYQDLYNIVNNRDNNKMYCFEIINLLLKKDIEFQSYGENKDVKAVKIDTSSDIQELLKQ